MLFCRIRSWVTGNRIVSLPFSDHCAPLCEPDEKFASFICHLHTARAGHIWKYFELRPVSGSVGEPVKKLGLGLAAMYVMQRVDSKPAAEDIVRLLNKRSTQ